MELLDFLRLQPDLTDKSCMELLCSLSRSVALPTGTIVDILVERQFRESLQWLLMRQRPQSITIAEVLQTASKMDPELLFETVCGLFEHAPWFEEEATLKEIVHGCVSLNLQTLLQRLHTKYETIFPYFPAFTATAQHNRRGVLSWLLGLPVEWSSAISQEACVIAAAHGHAEVMSVLHERFAKDWCASQQKDRTEKNMLLFACLHHHGEVIDWCMEKEFPLTPEMLKALLYKDESAGRKHSHVRKWWTSKWSKVVDRQSLAMMVTYADMQPFFAEAWLAAGEPNEEKVRQLVVDVSACESIGMNTDYLVRLLEGRSLPDDLLHEVFENLISGKADRGGCGGEEFFACLLRTAGRPSASLLESWKQKALDTEHYALWLILSDRKVYS